MRLNIQLFAVTKSTTFAESDISIENNTSTLKITIKFSPNNDVTYFSSKTLNCTCNGVKKSASVSLSKGGSVTKSFTFTGIKHNTDGTKSVSWSWSCATGTSVLGTISDSGTKTLTTIQRYGKITNISGAITNSTITIDWHSYNANWVYDLRIDGYYTYRNIGSSVGDHTININVGNDYFNNASTEEILPITYSLKTYPSDGSWSYFNSLNTMILLNDEVKPTISIGTITEADTTMQGLNWGVFVQNKSKLNISTTSNGAVDSKIKQVSLGTNGQTLNYQPTTATSPLSHTFTTDFLKTSGTNTITAVSTDSRNRSSTPATTTLNVVAYSNPTITTATVQRCNQDKSLNDNGTYLLINFVGSISPVSNHNDKEFRIGYKKTTESSYTYVTLSSTYSVNLTNELSSFQVDPDYSYNIVFEAEDTFTTTKIDRLVEAGSDLINFNTNGKALAIGKVSEAGANEEKFEVAVPTTFTEYIKDELVVENIRSKNMCNSYHNNCAWGYADGYFYTGTPYTACGGKIKVKPNTTYTISSYGTRNGQTSPSETGAIFYDSSGNYMSSQRGYTITTPTNCYYLTFNTNKNDDSDLQLEAGNTATNYTPYQNLDNTGVVLFEGAVNGSNVSLNENITNYQYVEVFYGTSYDGLQQRSHKLKTNTSYFVLELDELDASSNNYGFVICFNKFQNNGTSLNFVAGGRVYKYDNMTDWAQDHNNPIFISKVVGYR